MYNSASFNEWHRQRAELQPYFGRVFDRVAQLFDGKDTVLDLAGGDGRTLDVIPGLAPNIVTTDHDQTALDRLQDRHPGTASALADMNDLPFDDESFDAAISISGFTSVAPSKKVAAEVERVLKPGGVFVYVHDNIFRPQLLADEVFSNMPDGYETPIILPVINKDSRAVDQVAVIDPLEFLQPEIVYGNASNVVEFALSQPFDPDWAAKVYSHNLLIAGFAEVFTPLVDQVSRLAMPGSFALTDPYAPQRENSNVARCNGTSLQVTKEVVMVDYITDEPYIVEDRPTEDLFVDRLVIPHLSGFFEAEKRAHEVEATRVHGGTPIYIARKP